MKILFLATIATGLLAVLIGSVTIAYAQTPDQSFGGTYVALALAVISLITNAFNAYLAEKAKRVGLNPNATDEKLINFVMGMMEHVKSNSGAITQLTNFLYKDVAPEKAQQIVEGSLPLIKISELTKKVQEADQKLQTGAKLLDAIGSKASPAPN
jgi:hypothetical protein